jgi:multiple sugar transport system permease protein
MFARTETVNRIKQKGLSQRQLGYILVTPALLLIVFVSVYPFLITIWYSLHKIRLNIPAAGRPFVGLQNYVTLFQSGRFRHSLLITFLFSSAWVAVEFVFGLCIALVLNRRFRGRALVRASVLVPWAMALVITALLWQWMFNPVFGLLNALLMALKIIREPINWLGTTAFSAYLSVLVVDVWRNTPFVALILLAGLQGIPGTLYEAARIDGAGRIGCFVHITMPQLKHAILVALLFRSIDAFRSFDLLYVLTQGGPGRSTEIASLFAYKTLFQYLDFGKGSAATVIMALVTTALSIVYVTSLSSKD